MSGVIKLQSMVRFRFLFAGLMLYMFSNQSCYKDVVDLDLKDLDSQIVIECLITDQLGPYMVKISKTGAYDKPDYFQPVDGALITIRDDAGNSEQFNKTKTGIYQTTQFKGVPGRTYYLEVRVDGKEYFASSIMPKALKLDSIMVDSYASFRSIQLSFTDRVGVEDFCRLRIYKNRSFVEDILYQGRFTDGEQIKIEEINSDFWQNDYVQIEMLTFDEATFEYFSLLQHAVIGSTVEDFLDVELPSISNERMFNPTSNLSTGALGYFSACAIRTYSLVLE